jgi:hypothetical protein
MFSTDPDDRHDFISGLRALADYLEARPGMPVSHYGATISVIAADVEDGGRAEIYHMSGCLGAPVITAGDGTLQTGKTFGSVTYRAFAMSKAARTVDSAQRSYYGCVIPGEGVPDA